MITGKYPSLRLRRTRKQSWSRRLIQENTLTANDFILPVFLIDGSNKKQSISTMPGVYRYTINRLSQIIDKALKVGIPMVALFPKTKNSLKNEIGSESLNENNFFKITFPDSKKPSYLYLGNAPSKTETFDYMIILDHNLSIEKIKILAYRESWGGEISSNRWLKQFTGAQGGKKYVYRENISAISGATISVKSMTRSINYFLSDLDKLNSINFFN